jgi:hypothetical protein
MWGKEYEDISVVGDVSNELLEALLPQERDTPESSKPVNLPKLLLYHFSDVIYILLGTN